MVVDAYQNIIIWKYVEERSSQKIAQITGKTEGSVSVGLHRALGALKAQMPNLSHDVLSPSVYP